MATVQEGQTVAGVAAVVDIDGPLGQVLDIGVSVADLPTLLGVQVGAPRGKGMGPLGEAIRLSRS